MKLKEFLEIVNYDEFDISKDEDCSLKTICKISKYMPLGCLSEKFLNTEIENVFIDDNFKENDNDLITIAVKWEDN